MENANGVIDLTSGNYGITEWEGFNVLEHQPTSPFQDGIP